MTAFDLLAIWRLEAGLENGLRLLDLDPKIAHRLHLAAGAKVPCVRIPRDLLGRSQIDARPVYSDHGDVRLPVTMSDAGCGEQQSAMLEGLISGSFVSESGKGSSLTPAA